MSAQFDLEPVFSEDALEQKRQQDILAVEDFLKHHEILGSFFRHNWVEFKNYIRVEEYHKDIRVIKHEEVSRKLYLLWQGDISAFILTTLTPKPHYIFNFPQGYILTELNGLLGDAHHFGLMAMSDCKLISFDLDYIEHEEQNYELFSKFIDTIYPVSGQLTTELCNILLEQKIGLKDILKKHNFFHQIDNLDEPELHKLADNMKFIFQPKSEILIDENNNEYFYLVEAGTVSQTKQIKIMQESDSYVYTRSLQSVYVNDNEGNLQEVFLRHMEIEEQLNQRPEFERAIVNAEHSYAYEISPKTSDSSDIQYKQETITINEDINRYGVVGEEVMNLDSQNSIEAITKTDCCLIQIEASQLVPKYSLFEQVVRFFNYKVDDMQARIINKQNNEVNLKNKYIALVNFSFLFMVIMAILGISGRTHGYVNLYSQGAMMHHLIVIAVSCGFLISFLRPLNFSLQELGFTSQNFKKALMQAAIALISLVFIVTIIKDFYIQLFTTSEDGYMLFQPDLLVNDNLSQAGFIVFLGLYLVYIFMYELCARGILQNIFSIILTNSYKLQYWGSIFAASAVASQFHMSLFHEFSFTLFLGNIFCGMIFANTRNLWVVIIFHSLFSIYILTVLGLLPGSHY